MNPVKETALGIKNGVNKVFHTSAAYRPGTVVPFLNGAAVHSEKVSEGPGTAYTLDVAPLATDQVAHYFIPVT